MLSFDSLPKTWQAPAFPFITELDERDRCAHACNGSLHYRNISCNIQLYSRWFKCLKSSSVQQQEGCSEAMVQSSTPPKHTAAELVLLRCERISIGNVWHYWYQFNVWTSVVTADTKEPLHRANTLSLSLIKFVSTSKKSTVEKPCSHKIWTHISCTVLLVAGEIRRVFLINVFEVQLHIHCLFARCRWQRDVMSDLSRL